MRISPYAAGSSQQPLGEEKRSATRQKLFEEGWADPGGAASPLVCKISNISHKGAKIALADENALPDNFILHVGSARRAARVVWRSQNQIGVEFQ